MSIKNRLAIVVALVGALVIAFGGAASSQLDLPGMQNADESTGGLIGPAVGELGNTEHGPCVEDLLDLPALGACEDAEGRVIMDLPALKLIGPAAPELPETGANIGDIAAIGLAALAGGGVMLRRLRFSFAR